MRLEASENDAFERRVVNFRDLQRPIHSKFTDVFAFMTLQDAINNDIGDAIYPAFTNVIEIFVTL